MIMTTVTPTLAVKAKFFRGFADPARLAILEVLREGEKTVSEVVGLTGLSQSNTSNHLGCLRDCELVSAQQRGRFVYYQLRDPSIAQFLALADAVLTDVAHGVSACTRYCQDAE